MNRIAPYTPLQKRPPITPVPAAGKKPGTENREWKACYPILPQYGFLLAAKPWGNDSSHKGRLSVIVIVIVIIIVIIVVVIVVVTLA